MARIKAHFDGRVFVPDEPVNLRAGERVEVDLSPSDGPNTNGAGAKALNPERFFGSFTAPVLPDEAFTREQMYRDDR